MSEENLFELALRTPVGELVALLDHACGGNAELRARVEDRLKAASATEATTGFQATASYASPEPAPGLNIAGRYTLEQKLGEGGMGEVWVARQSEPVKRKVALKLIKAGMDSKSVVQRFEQERQALAMMDHPHIAKVLDGGITADRRPFFVMELVKGLPLTRFCDDAKLGIRERLELFVPICQAVQHAHQKGIVHRDLKPGNILVTIIDGKPVPKVIDFGVAKATSGRLTEESLSTQFGAVVGTLEYMSPEQAGFTGQDIDTRADIYSLGVILYELLTGLRPFDSKRLKKAALDEMIRIIREEEPSKPSTRLSTDEALPSLAAIRHIEPGKLTALLRGELDWVVMKCLEKQRDRRYETASGLARDIQRYLGNEMVEARPPSLGYHLSKFLIRNRGPVLATVAIALCLLVGIICTSLGLLWALHERNDKERAMQEALDNEAKAIRERDAKNQALVAEAVQRAKAENARDRTRQALDAMVSGVTGKSLSTQTSITAEQQKFLTEVLTYYKEFAGENAADEQTRARTAKAASSVGWIESRLGRKEEGIAAFQMAQADFEKLNTDYPTIPHYREALADSHNSLGLLLADLGKWTEAKSQYDKALIINTKLTIDFPEKPDHQNRLASNHNNLGLVLLNLGNYPESQIQHGKALAHYEKLVAEFPETPDYRQNLAASYHCLGVVLERVSKPLEAKKQYLKGLAIRQKLVKDYPTVPDYRHQLAFSHNNLGVLASHLDQRQEAVDQIRMAIEIREKLSADFPSLAEYRHWLGANHTNLGLMLNDMDNPLDAEQQHRIALAIQEKLVTDFPTVPNYRRDLARSRSNLGLVLKTQGKQRDAVDQYRQGLATQERLVSDFPKVPGYQIDLGGSYCNFGNLFFSNGDLEESLPWYQKAIDTLRPVYEKNPRTETARQFLMSSYTSRARACNSLKQYADAITNWDHAIDLNEKRWLTALQEARANSKLRAGLVTEAVAEVTELMKLSNWNAGQLYNFACVHAVASGKIADKKKEYAELAIQLLKKTVKAGYQDTAQLKRDTDLDPLRDRDDFKKLLADMEEQARKRLEPPQKPHEK